MQINNTNELFKNFHVLERECQLAFEGGADSLIISVAEEKVARSNRQNAFYWKTIQKITDFLNESGCAKKVKVFNDIIELPFFKEDIHEMNKQIFGVKSSAKLSQKNFVEYMTKVELFWVEKTNGFWQPLETARQHMK